MAEEKRFETEDEEIAEGEIEEVPAPPGLPEPSVFPTPVMETVIPPVQEKKPVADDGLSDLFRVTTEDVMGGDDDDINDLTEVTDEDVFGEGGADLSDLTGVRFDEDIMGSGADPTLPLVWGKPAPRRLSGPRHRRGRFISKPPLGGMSGTG